MCETWLKARFLWEQYELGHVNISEWTKGATPAKSEAVDEFPPEHFLE